MARLERGALAAEKVIEELQARLREEQVALSGQREVLGGLVREREAEEAAEAQVGSERTISSRAEKLLGFHLGYSRVEWLL